MSTREDRADGVGHREPLPSIIDFTELSACDFSSRELRVVAEGLACCFVRRIPGSGSNRIAGGREKPEPSNTGCRWIDRDGEIPSMEGSVVTSAQGNKVVGAGATSTCPMLNVVQMEMGPSATVRMGTSTTVTAQHGTSHTRRGSASGPTEIDECAIR